MCVQTGALHRFIALLEPTGEGIVLQTIVERTAEACEADGRVDDAMQLYNLSDRYDKVMDILNRRLSDALCGLSSRESYESVRSVADSIRNYYHSRQPIRSAISEGRWATCQMLCHLGDFFKLFREGKFEQALAVIESIGLIPLSGDIAELSEKVDRFKRLDELITRNFTEILLTTQELFFSLYNQLKDANALDAGRQTVRSWFIFRTTMAKCTV